jgi:manganese/zinc/iron transport system permease protein
MNPYSGESFFGFFSVMMQRLALFFRGEGSSLASDEVQLLVLILIALSSALLGTFLVLRKMTMLANSLSHTILLGIVGAFLLSRFLFGGKEGVYAIHFPALIIGAVITALLTTFSTEFLYKRLRLQKDASIGLIFTAFFALGVVLVTILSRNSHLGVEAIMGNVDALHPDHLKQVFYLFLFLAFLVTPVVTARFFTHRLKPLLFLAGGIGAFAAIVSVALSRHFLSVYHLPLATSGLGAVILGSIFLCGALYKLRKTR